MDDARELILQDVRCFQDEQRGRLRPITLLVGENSTGKTTFLGCFRVLHRMFSRPGIGEFLDFNEEPFAMGSFRDIVRSRRGPSGRIDEFKIGFRVDRVPDDVLSPYELSVTFREKGSEPVASSLRFQFDSDAFLELRSGEDGTIVQIPDCAEEMNGVPLVHAMFMLNLLIDTPDWTRSPPKFQNLKPIADYLHGLFPRREVTSRPPAIPRSIGVELPNLPELISVAPLRSKPKRTYDPIRETASPEGEHIPMLMMRLDRTDTPHWKSLHDDLVKFGRGAGLFADIKVKRHGKQTNDPLSVAGQGPIRLPCEHHGRRLRRQPEPADSRRRAGTVRSPPRAQVCVPAPATGGPPAPTWPGGTRQSFRPGVQAEWKPVPDRDP